MHTVHQFNIKYQVAARSGFEHVNQDPVWEFVLHLMGLNKKHKYSLIRSRCHRLVPDFV